MNKITLFEQWQYIYTPGKKDSRELVYPIGRDRLAMYFLRWREKDQEWDVDDEYYHDYRFSKLATKREIHDFIIVKPGFPPEIKRLLQRHSFRRFYDKCDA